MARKLKQTLVRAAARGQKGFGLVETLVAVAILGTSVAAFISGLSAGSQPQRRYLSGGDSADGLQYIRQR